MAARVGHPLTFGFQRISSVPTTVRYCTTDADLVILQHVSERHVWETPSGARMTLDALTPAVKRLPIADVTVEQRREAMVRAWSSAVTPRWLFVSVEPAGAPGPPPGGLSMPRH